MMNHPACKIPGWQFIARLRFNPRLDCSEVSAHIPRLSCWPILIVICVDGLSVHLRCLQLLFLWMVGVLCSWVIAGTIHWTQRFAMAVGLIKRTRYVRRTMYTQYGVVQLEFCSWCGIEFFFFYDPHLKRGDCIWARLFVCLSVYPHRTLVFLFATACRIETKFSP